MTRDFTSVGVIGLGTMGAGIVEVFARNGIDVIAVEVDEAGIEHGKAVLGGSTGRALARGKLTQEEHDALHARVTYTSDLADLAGCQLVVEAVPEHLDLKKELLGKVDAVVSPDAVLATNTSSLPVTEIAVATSNPKRVVGMHFFNPAPVQQFVEVIRTVITADDVFEDVKALAERLGKKPVIVGDKAGFIANALLFGYLNHAVSMYESRYATREDLDAAMRFGCGYPMGPLALLDLIGLDTAYEILDTMYKQGRDRLHAPSPIIKQMVSAGLLGPQERSRASTPTPSRARRRSSPTPDARRRAAPRGVAAAGGVGGRRRVGDHGDRHHRGLREGRLPGHVRRPRRRQGRRRARRARPHTRAGGREGPDDGRGRRGAARPGDRCDHARGARRRRPRRRGDRRGPRGQAGPLPRPRPDLQARAPSSPRRPRRCRSSTAPRSPRGRRTSSGCTSSTRPRS